MARTKTAKLAATPAGTTAVRRVMLIIHNLFLPTFAARRLSRSGVKSAAVSVLSTVVSGEHVTNPLSLKARRGRERR